MKIYISINIVFIPPFTCACNTHYIQYGTHKTIMYKYNIEECISVYRDGAKKPLFSTPDNY